MSSQRDLRAMTMHELSALGMAAAALVLTCPEDAMEQAKEDARALFAEIGVLMPTSETMTTAEAGEIIDDVTLRWGIVLSGAALVARLAGLYAEHFSAGVLEPAVRELIAETLAD